MELTPRRGVVESTTDQTDGPTPAATPEAAAAKATPKADTPKAGTTKSGTAKSSTAKSGTAKAAPKQSAAKPDGDGQAAAKAAGGGRRTTAKKATPRKAAPRNAAARKTGATGTAASTGAGSKADTATPATTPAPAPAAAEAARAAETAEAAVPVAQVAAEQVVAEQPVAAQTAASAAGATHGDGDGLPVESVTGVGELSAARRMTGSTAVATLDAPDGAARDVDRAQARRDARPVQATVPFPTPRGVTAPMIGRIPILDVQPCVDCGAWPAKAVPGEPFTVTATVFREGHDAVACEVVLTDPEGVRRPPVRMHAWDDGSDRWSAEVMPDTVGAWHYAVEAWSDPLTTWRHRAEIKVPAGLDTDLELAEGALLYERAVAGVPDGEGRAKVEAALDALRDGGRSATDRLAAALAPDVAEILYRFPVRELVTSSRPLPLRVERERALFGSWYEMFPRSEGAVVDPSGQNPPRSGTFRTAAERLPALAEQGFDVVYLPPVHPVGRTFRKGPNNALVAGEHDPGSPWAIGSAEGGHDAIHPDLGTFEDFDYFVGRARELGLEVALDFALQAAPDHPWVHQHPEWFVHRADGTIAYAENPPKKYQDIYPIAFDADLEGLLAECERILRLWMSHGVRIFRVDNPHTKPVVFWERLLGDIRATDPDVVFLAEAFTRPAMMRTLAKIGFQQSYTYFTWRNTRAELEEYLRELSSETAAYMRPNFFVNTPDILHEYLQHGGPAAFRIRATVASMLSPSWGVYSGFELFEAAPVRPGSEEYLDSEKYQYRPRDFDAAAREARTLAPYLALLNRLRREHPSLRRLRNLRFHHADNDAILVFSKRLTAEQLAAAGLTMGREPGVDDTVLVVVNLDPHHVHEATIRLDLPELGYGWHDGITVEDQITGATYRWGEYNYVRLDPAYEVAHILTVRRSVP